MFKRSGDQRGNGCRKIFIFYALIYGNTLSLLSLLFLLSLLVPGVLEFSTEVWSFPSTWRRRVRTGCLGRESHFYLTSYTLRSTFCCSRSRSPALAPAPGKTRGARQPSRVPLAPSPSRRKPCPGGKAGSSLPSTCRGTVAPAQQATPSRSCCHPGTPGLPRLAGLESRELPRSPRSEGASARCPLPAVPREALARGAAALPAPGHSQWKLEVNLKKRKVR